jgi:leucyl-tRNA synthetase
VYTLVWRWHERLGDSLQQQEAPADDAFSPAARALRRKTHQTIARITRDFEQLHLNTSVALLMELFNALSEFNAEPASASAADMFAVREAIEALVVMLTPFCPHIAEEMWEGLGHSAFLDGQIKWPVADADLARQEELEIPLQVNGKLRSRILTTPEVTDDELRVAALADEKVRGFIDGHQVVKVIVVPQRLVNVVIK